MKNIIYLLPFILIITSCEYDNYEAPDALLTGKIVYEGQPIGVSNGVNLLQLYEKGWDNYSPINMNVKQDGSFSSILFEGDYQLVLISGKGPWVNDTDTIDVQVRGGETKIEVPVQPFYHVASVDYSVADKVLSASFNLDQVSAGDLEYVALFVADQILVDEKDFTKKGQKKAADITDISAPMQIDVDMGDISSEYIFARVGIKVKERAE